VRYSDGLRADVPETKTRILLLARELHHGGCERQLTSVALALDRGRFEVHAGAFRLEGIRSRDLGAAGVPLVDIGIESYRQPTAAPALWRLARYIREKRIDLVHAFDVPLTVAAMPLVRSLARPAIALASQRSHLDLISKRERRLLLWAERLAHGVVVNCEHIRRHLVEDANIPPEKIYLCRNGIDLDRFSRNGSPRPATLPAGSLVIGTVCVLRPEKGLTNLVDAFAMVHRAAPNLRLLFVGSGPMLPELQRHARELGVMEACIFEPTTSDVPAWLRHIDIFVLPSLSEALSNSLMEAMACGCCAVASQVGGNPELVQDGLTGLLFERGNIADLARALREAILNADLRRYLADAGHDFLHTNFSIASSARRMGEIYRELQASRGKPRALTA
jgi:glycosyltransferase involved in cell wall biosynthesis